MVSNILLAGHVFCIALLKNGKILLLGVNCNDKYYLKGITNLFCTKTEFSSFVLSTFNGKT